ncbi:MAG: carboxylesterase family protein [Alteromonadaceae bacterium]|nr:carboxylesterase family protein [Alteromonadaceae bacterium]
MIKLLKVLFWASCGMLVACHNPPSSTEADTDFTTINLRQASVTGVVKNDLIEFRGIPYAAAPVGDLRWRAPQPAPALPAHFVADTYGSQCYQAPRMQGWPKEQDFATSESEDCLYLNIYRPNTQADQLPVMVWIHGGGLTSGSGSRAVSWGGNLANQDVLVVSFNYRLGRLGFFAHPQLSEQNPDDGLLYNYGIMDQLALLKWVQQHIAQFGGDPNRVTIFGESAGAASVMALMATPLADGLFNRAISQSGYGLRMMQTLASQSKDPADGVEQIGVDIARQLNHTQATLAELRATPPEAIIGATDYTQFIQLAVDGTMFTDTLAQIYAQGRQIKVPMIVGTTDAESVFGTSQLEVLRGYMSDDTLTKMTPYYDDEATRNLFMLSDFSFHSQARALVNTLAKQQVPVYSYRFSMPGKYSTRRMLNGEVNYGALHAGDVPYTFGNFLGEQADPVAPDAMQKQVASQMINYWTNFAKNGHPNAPALPKWPQAKEGVVMQFSPLGSQARPDSWIDRLDYLNELTGLTRQ